MRGFHQHLPNPPSFFFFLLSLFFYNSITICAFQVPSPISSTSSTTLHAITPPSFIIGPFIRKMRENKEKANQPFYQESELEGEAPGLKVGSSVWKWPPIWPYDERPFQRNTGDDAAQLSTMANMLSGGVGAMADVTPVATVEELDIEKYWSEEKKDVRTELEAEAVSILRNHNAFYVKDGMSVLEFGAAEESYLPEYIKLERHVGLSLSEYLMDQNPSLTEKYVVDLNKIVKEMGIDSPAINDLGEDVFDIILMSNTVDFLTNPREVFRSAFRLLKPGGTMIVPFTEKDAYVSKFGEAQINMWSSYNDDQHMWIIGSFFQFSAADGWCNLKGFDISSEAAKKEIPIIGKLLENFENKDTKPTKTYVVQATKSIVREEIDEENAEQSFRSKMWILPTIEERDKELVGPRLACMYKSLDYEKKEKLVESITLLPRVYESLIKMDQFAFPFNLQAQLAVDIVSDADFAATDEQLLALRMGLGLRKPDPEFWAPVGDLTSGMTPEDKISLLSFLVPRCGTSSPSTLNAFVTGMKPTFSLIRNKCPKLSEADVQTLGTDLLASEIVAGGVSRRNFAQWLEESTEEELLELLKERNSVKIEAVAKMTTMQEERKRKEEEEEEMREKMKNQVETARKERTMILNPNTGKMEVRD